NCFECFKSLIVNQSEVINMKKSYIKLAVIIVVFVIAALSFAIYQQFKTTTYEKAMPESLVKKEKIEQITISYCTPDENTTDDKTMTIKDEKNINQLRDESKDILLKKTSTRTAPLYVVEIKIVDARPRLLTINDQDITATKATSKTKDYYQIINENKLSNVLEENEREKTGKNE